MDILTRLAHEWYWDNLGNLDLIYRMLLLRWAAILAWLFMAGWIVRYVLFPRLPAQTLLIQVIAIFVAVVVGLWMPIDAPNYWNPNSRTSLLSLALIGWLVLPFFIPQMLIRRRGCIEIAWRALYGLEAALIVIQVIVK